MPIDPVCGMQVDESTPHKLERGGKTYYFCCPNCLAKFAGQKTASKTHTPKSAKYFCPMCEGVESDKPGTCPKCGMALEPAQPTAGEQDDSELLDMSRRFWASLALTVPIFALSMLPMIGVNISQWIAASTSRSLQYLLCTVIVVWPAFPLFERAWKSLTTMRINMFTLIGLGIATAYLFSAFAIMFPNVIPAAFRSGDDIPVYFESAAMITVLVLLGQVLELRARRRTGDALRELISLAPPNARVVRHGSVKEVPLSSVKVGDVVQVRPGERIPLDGTIQDGNSTIDESMLTGEPMPVAKNINDHVIGGTMNQNGALQIRVDKTGEETVLAQIVSLVAQAQRSRAPIQRTVDKVSAIFVPLVLLAALLTFVAWNYFLPHQPAFGLVSAIAVLMIACPCALGLATPMSIMVGVGRGAHNGILIKNAEVLETLGQVDTVVVDKTGTLTEGKPSVTDVIAADDTSENELLRWSASVEQNSAHPLGVSVVSAAKMRNLELSAVDDFHSETGKGVRGNIDGCAVVVGSHAFLQEHEAMGLDSFEERANTLQAKGRTVVFVAKDNKAVGILAVSDAIKSTASETVRSLQSMGCRVIMLTGDQEKTASIVARELMIDQFHAGILPAEKYGIVHRLREEGNWVAMAGDGVNDAPALAEADVGVAMGDGTDVAIQTADVVLLKGDIRGIEKAIRLSRSVMRNVRQNLFFAFIYNLLGIPIAAGLLYPIFGLLLSPMIAAAAMSMSSVSVIANALRLRTALS